MSRAAIYKALATDAELISMGIDGDSVFPNYTLDTPPSRRKPFIIIRWGAQIFSGGTHRGPRDFELWFHMPKQHSSDHAKLDPIIARATKILTGMVHVAGEDGFVVTGITGGEPGSDLEDQAYDTIVRNAAYRVLSRAA